MVAESGARMVAELRQIGQQNRDKNGSSIGARMVAKQKQHDSRMVTE